MIRDGKLRIFAPFTNSEFQNTWSEHLRIEGDGTLDSYYTKKSGLYREEQIEPDRSKWWANGNIICNELTKFDDKTKSQHWGDHFLTPLRDMLGEACREREMPDCEFFLNKRDYPQLKVNIPRGEPVEPYGFIFDKGNIDPIGGYISIICFLLCQQEHALVMVEVYTLLSSVFFSPLVNFFPFPLALSLTLLYIQ